MTIKEALSLIYEMKDTLAMNLQTVEQELPREWEEAVRFVSSVLLNPGNYYF